MAKLIDFIKDLSLCDAIAAFFDNTLDLTLTQKFLINFVVAFVERFLGKD